MKFEIKKLEINYSNLVAIDNIDKLKSEIGKGNNVIQFSEIGMKNLLVFFTIYNLNKDAIAEKESENFKKEIISDKFSIYKMTRQFMLFMIENFDTITQNELKSLTEASYEKSSLFSNSTILNFADENVLDPFLSFRSYEYGNFILKSLTNDCFKDLSISDKNSIINRVIATNNFITFFKPYLQQITSELSKNEYLILLYIFKQGFFPKSVTMADKLVVGEITQRQMPLLHKRHQKLKQETLQILNKIRKNRDKKRRKGPRR